MVCLQEAEPQVRHQVPEGAVEAVEAEAEAAVEFRRLVDQLSHRYPG